MSTLDQTRLFHLTDRGALCLTGVDSKKFLQGQTTCDLNHLSEGHSQTGAICTPKGRMLCHFHLLQKGEENLLMVLHADLVKITLDALGKYAVFSKTTLEDCTPRYQILGLAGPNADTVLASLFTELPAKPGESRTTRDLVTVQIEAGRYLVIAPAESAQQVQSLLAPQTTPADLSYWHLLDIRAGHGEVRPETVETFIPQMLNLQATGGISFKKGCYTGQEVVARMQYLGKLKRRMYHLRVEGGDIPPPGSACHLPGGEQSIGHVVFAAPAEETAVEMLAVLTEEGAAASSLEIAGNRRNIDCLPLPYSLETP